MSNVISWSVSLQIKDDKSYEKLITYLGKSHLYTFEAEPNTMLESSNTHTVIVYCSWTNNLRYLAKWIDKNISDEMIL